MFKFIKRLFGLDYNDHSEAAAKHSGVGSNGLATVEDAVANIPFAEVPVEAVPETEPTPVAEAKPVKEKKPRKPAAKKAAPKKATKKTK